MKSTLCKTLVLLWLIIAAGPAAQAAARPDKWAQPLEMPGVPNLHKVSDQLYRSAQPTAAGLRNLKNLGIKTIVNLRSFHSDRDEIGDTGLAYAHIYMKAWHPEEEDIVRFLQIVTDPQRTPALVHCQHGADRTGAMVALYRIVVQGWTREEALREMLDGGFGFHGIWENVIKWINRVNIEAIKNKVKMAGGKE